MEYLYAFFALLAGVGSFLIGCKLLSDNMEKLANTKIKDLFNKTSKSKLAGVGIGCATTALIQSSALTTVMVVGFVNAGIMSLYQATTIIMGANIGTTVTAQMAALQSFSFTNIAMGLAGVGVFINIFSKKDRVKIISNILSGLGLVFVGLQVMGDSMNIVKESEKIIELFSSLKNPLLLFIVGTLLTALIQSSSATTSIVITMAGAGIVIGNGGNSVLFVILGTNIGTCVTALLSSIGASANAKRASVIHLLFNVIGASLFFVLLLFWPSFMSQTLERWFEYPTTQIAMFHTLFNVTCTIIFLPFTNGFVKLSKLLVKDKTAIKQTYLDKRFLATPIIAIEYATKESMKMLDISVDCLDKSLDSFINCDNSRNDEILNQNTLINEMCSEVTSYLINISATNLSVLEEKMISALHSANGDIVRVSELANNITKYTDREVRENLVFSIYVRDQLKLMMDKIKKLHFITNKIILEKDKSLISEADDLEESIDDYRKMLIKDHIARLNNGECRAENSSVFINLVCNLERAGDHISYIAHSKDEI